MTPFDAMSDQSSQPLTPEQLRILNEIPPSDFRAMLKEIYEHDRATCPGCGNRVDWEVCWCGEEKRLHTAEHSFVPMGCDCGRCTE
jgi:hypothetical protein